jgi:hypothetical protein
VVWEDGGGNSASYPIRSFATQSIESIGKEIDSTPGGHGGPPLQFVHWFTPRARSFPFIDSRTLQVSRRSAAAVISAVGFCAESHMR